MLHRIVKYGFAAVLLLGNVDGIAAETWIAGWQPASPMNTPRAGAAVIEVNGVIHAIGGIDGVDFLRSAEYSRIRPDGSLAPWQPSSPLNEPRGFFDAAASGDYVYVAGGGSGHNLLRSVERARIQPDGSLGAWESEQQQLNLPRRCSKLFITGHFIYAVGGFGGTLLDSVERAEILDDGHLGSWRLLDDHLTVPRYVTAVNETADAVYIFGGHDEMGGAGITSVERAVMDKHGGISVWRQTSPMTIGRFALAAAAHGNHVYALGGLSVATYFDAIEVADVDSSGATRWRATTPLPVPLADFSTVVYRDNIYVVGGTNRDGYYNGVASATFNKDGDIGFYGSEADAKRVQTRQTTATRPSPLPNGGEVLEVLQSGDYTYVRTTGAAGELWLAGPHIEVVPGDRVQFSRGVEMGNFFSRSLQRTFPAIRFVEQLEKQP